MKTAIPAWAIGLRPDQIAFFENKAMTVSRARCRGTGRHQFHLNDLEMRASGEPKGVEIIPLDDGTCEVRDWCKRDCGRYQSYLTNDDGEILWDTREYGGERDYIGTGLDLRRTGADSRYLHHLTQELIGPAIAKRLKTARRTATVHIVSDAV
jgi:hypothetical protein